MSVITIIKELKQIHPEYITIIKIGNFYNVYSKDAYIFSYLFKYKLKEMEEGIKSTGFPLSSLKRIIATLENKSINYMIIDRRNNYEIDDKFEVGNLNKYNEVYNKAKKQYNANERIEKISQYLYENIDSTEVQEILKRLEVIMHEQRNFEQNEQKHV